MSMQLICEKLLEREIKRIEEQGIPKDQEIIYHLCKKELAVIEKLKINKIDMRGEIEEVQERIKNQSLYFMGEKEFEKMEEKARKYDLICGIIKNQVS